MAFRVLIALIFVICPYARPATAATNYSVPASPVNPEENHEEKEEHASKSHEYTDGHSRKARLLGSSSSNRVLVPPISPQLQSRILPRAADHDPFCNGLGTHIRC